MSLPILGLCPDFLSVRPFKMFIPIKKPRLWMIMEIAFQLDASLFFLDTMK